MKTLATRLMIFAASAVVLGTMAYGQINVKAEIPFAFHTANGTLPAGTYQLIDQSNHNSPYIVRLSNSSTRQGVFLTSLPPDSYRTGRAALVFTCGNRGCRLSQIRTSAGTYTYYVPPKAGRNKESASVVEIPLINVG